MKTAVIILNYNGLALLQEFLPSVIEYSQGAEIVVADNGSTDNSVEWLRSEQPTIRILAFDQNYGFAEGYNKAIAAVESQYVVLLNSDVQVSDHWLTPLEAYLDTHAQVAACQPKIKSFKNPNMFEYAGACGGFMDQYGYPYCRGRVMNHIEEDFGQYDTPISIFWATGACLFIRRDIYLNIGGLDKRFFAHMEEIDLCWRLNARGHLIKCLPESVVYHVGGATLNEEHPRKTYLNFRNNALMLYKNTPKPLFVRIAIIRTLLDYVAALQMLLHGKRVNAYQILRARADYQKMKHDFAPSREDNLRLTTQKKLMGQLNHLLLWRVYMKHEQTYEALPTPYLETSKC